jgi:TonB family protein
MLTSTRNALLVALLSIALSVSAQENVDVTHLLDPAGDRMPLQTVVPVYPERALRDRVQGDVEVCFNVDREGRTSRISVRQSSHRMFEKPSTLAVRASSYVPLKEHEILSGIKTCRIFRFRLDPVAIEDPSWLVDPDDSSISVEP